MDSTPEIVSISTPAQTELTPPFATPIQRIAQLSVIRFGFVSTVSTVIDFLVLYLLLKPLQAMLQAWLATFLAVGAGYLVGTVVNFVLARRLVFRPSRFEAHVEFILVAVVAAIGFALTEMITIALSTRLCSHLFLAKTTAVLVAKIAAVVIVFFWNFFARRQLIYKGSATP